jgi:hypothetical protein
MPVRKQGSELPHHLPGRENQTSRHLSHESSEALALTNADELAKKKDKSCGLTAGDANLAFASRLGLQL